MLAISQFESDTRGYLFNSCGHYRKNQYLYLIVVLTNCSKNVVLVITFHPIHLSRVASADPIPGLSATTTNIDWSTVKYTAAKFSAND
jgi:hypothetical protein